jgi:hypothetical protein
MVVLHLLTVKLALHFVYDSLNAKLHQHLRDEVKAGQSAFYKHEQSATEVFCYSSYFRAAKRVTWTTRNS